MPKGGGGSGGKKNKKAVSSRPTMVAESMVGLAASSTSAKLPNNSMISSVSGIGGDFVNGRTDADNILAGLESLQLRGGLELDFDALDEDALGLGTPAEEISPRLLALQQQLERLEADRYALSSAGQSPIAGKSPANLPLSSTTSPGSSINTERSLQTLKKRLGEVRQQLYGATSVHPTSLASLAKNYFGGVLRSGGHVSTTNANANTNNTASPPVSSSVSEFVGSIPGGMKRMHVDGGRIEVLEDTTTNILPPTVTHDTAANAVDILGEVEDEEYDFSEAEFLEDELLAAAAAAGVDLSETLMAPDGAHPSSFLNSVRLMRKLFPSTSNGPQLLASSLEAPVEYAVNGSSNSDFGERTLVELQELLSELVNTFPSAVPPDDHKISHLRERLQALLRNDRVLWRARLASTARLAQDERMQRQLLELELDKAQAIRTRLEGLCRDLHAENRRMKTEKLQSTINPVTSPPLATNTPTTTTNTNSNPTSSFPLIEVPDKSILSGESSAILADRIVGLADLFLLREQHFAQLLRLKESETLLAQERATGLAEQLAKQTALLDATTRRVTALTRSEADLKGQVRQYVDKFRQVEETLGKSNDLFGTFRAEMEQMGAKLARLERENTQLNSKCATLSKNIIEMADERTRQSAQYETLKGQKAKLEALCRTLQAERNAALKGVAVSTHSNANSNNVTTDGTVSSEIVEEPEGSPAAAKIIP